METRRGHGSVWWVLLLALAGCDNIRFQRPELLVTLSDPLFDFGIVALGEAPQRTLTVTNNGRATVGLGRLVAPSPWKIDGPVSDDDELAPGERRQYTVTFAPELEGRFEGSISVPADDQDEPRLVAVMGKAVRAYAGTTAEVLDFGKVAIGTSKVLTFAATNDTELPVTAAIAVEGADAIMFGSDLVNPDGTFTLEPGASFDIPVAFRPSHLGAADAWLAFYPCPDCTARNVALKGEGTVSCLGVSPARVDFGTVDVLSTAKQAVEVENVGTEDVQLSEVFFSSKSSPDFSFSGFTNGQPVSLAPGQKTTLELAFNPASKGRKDGSLKLRTAGTSSACYAEVAVTGNGGTGCIEVAPLVLDFGSIAAGMSSRKAATVANTACGGDVWIEKLEVKGGGPFTAGVTRPTPFLLKQGDVVDVQVTYSPAAAGTYTGEVALTATDDKRRPLAKPPMPIELKGTARVLPPCSFTVTPGRLDFGAVAANTTTQLAMTVKNVGADACSFTNVALSQGSSPAFQLAYSTLSSFNLDPGKSYDIRTRFKPTAVGSFTAQLELYVNDPKQPLRTFPMNGSAVTGCLSVEPTDLEFGTVAVGCKAPVLSSAITNNCSAPVVIQGVAAGQGNSTEVSLQNMPAFPRTLNPGDVVRLDIKYQPVDDGFDAVPFYVDDGTDRRLIAAHGRGVVNPRQTDRFDQVERAKVDVLIVMDNSGSMMEEQDAISRNFGSFMKFAIAQNIDYHIGVTTTGIDPSPGGWSTCPGGVEGGEAGRLFPADNSRPRIITPTTANGAAVFANNVKVGVCHWLEQGIDAAYRALSTPLVDHADDPRTPLINDGNLGFLRDDAKLALLFVSDEEDQSTQTVDYYLTYLKSLKANASLLTVSAIVGPTDLSTCSTASSSGNRYMELARRTGGSIDSICVSDWSATLEKIGAVAFGPTTIFPLSQKPATANDITVKVNGTTVTGTWSYDATSNSVVFDLNQAPPAGSRIEISYPLGCPP